MRTLRIATRESNLALWQARHVKQLLESVHEDLACEIVGMTTLGDRDKVSPLSQMGGKGVFIKELETGLLDGSVDIAVHSMKDVPGELPAGLQIGAICERASAEDAFVCNDYASLQELPDGAVVGSSSLRRVLQLKQAYPSLVFKDLRGNVETRLKKLDDGEYDAIILAVAGLQRLGFGNRIAQNIDASLCIPAAGQGAVGVEYRSDDSGVAELLAAVDHSASATCVAAERRVTQILEATCNLPIAAHATLDEQMIRIRAFVASLDGAESVRRERSGPAVDSLAVAEALAHELLDAGAGRLIAAAR